MNCEIYWNPYCIDIFFLENKDSKLSVEKISDINTAFYYIQVYENVNNNKNKCNSCKEKDRCYNYNIINKVITNDDIKKLDYIKTEAYKYISSINSDGIVDEIKDINTKSLKLLFQTKKDLKLRNEQLYSILDVKGHIIIEIILSDSRLMTKYIKFINNVMFSGRIELLEAISYLQTDKIDNILNSININDIDKYINNCLDSDCIKTKYFLIYKLINMKNRLSKGLSQDTINKLNRYRFNILETFELSFSYTEFNEYTRNILFNALIYIETYGNIYGIIKYLKDNVFSYYDNLIDFLTNKEINLNRDDIIILIEKSKKSNVSYLYTKYAKYTENCINTAVRCICDLCHRLGMDIEEVINYYLQVVLKERYSISNFYLGLNGHNSWLNRCITMVTAIESITRQYNSFCTSSYTMSNEMYNPIRYNEIIGKNGRLFNDIDAFIINQYLNSSIGDKDCGFNYDLRNKYLHGVLNNLDEQHHMLNFVKIVRIMLLVIVIIDSDLETYYKIN